MEFKEKAVLGMRVFQLICTAMFVSGFVWATSDLLLVSVLVEAPVTPLSVLIMLYSGIGILGSEMAVRITRRQKEQ